MPMQGIERFAQEHEIIDYEEEAKAFRKSITPYLSHEIWVAALTLRYVHGASYRDIAEELNMPGPSTAYYTVKRAQELLKEAGWMK